MTELVKAIEAVKRGEIVLMHDGGKRENEIDMIVNASHISPGKIRQMRKDGGGLICLAILGKSAERLNLPFMTDLIECSGNKCISKLVPEKTPYGDRPAFSLHINHKDTFTGITDNDRSLTIKEFSRVMENGHSDSYTDEFYSPGHVPLLIAKDISERKGHTELSIELAKRAGVTPAMVLCEMMGDDHKALTLKAAREYAQEHGLVLIDGSELYEL